MTGDGFLQLVYVLMENQARLWLPNSEHFFQSLEETLIRALRVLNNCDEESAQYWLSRLDNLGETLNLFSARARQAHPERQVLYRLITNLLEVVWWLRIQFGNTALRVVEQEQAFHDHVQQHTSNVEHSGEVGRPRCRNTVGEQQLRYLRDNLGLRWADIARCLSVSERTLRRWRYQFGLMTSDYTNLTNGQIDEHVRDILQSTPRVGLSLLRGALRARGLNVQRERVRESINRVDPLSRTIHHTEFITRRTMCGPLIHSGE